MSRVTPTAAASGSYCLARSTVCARGLSLGDFGRERVLRVQSGLTRFYVGQQGQRDIMGELSKNSSGLSVNVMLLEVLLTEDVWLFLPLQKVHHVTISLEKE